VIVQPMTRALTACAAAALLGVLVGACGAKSGLRVEPLDASVVDGGARDAAFDEGFGDLGALRDAGMLDEGTVVRDAGCRGDEECADLIACTRTRCSARGLCEVAPDATACDDGVFCTGVERCDLIKDFLRRA